MNWPQTCRSSSFFYVGWMSGTSAREDFGHSRSRSSDSKPNRLHVDIFRFCFIRLTYILQIPLKWSVNFLKSPTSTGYVSKPNRFIWNSPPDFPGHREVRSYAAIPSPDFCRLVLKMSNCIAMRKFQPSKCKVQMEAASNQPKQPLLAPDPMF